MLSVKNNDLGHIDVLLQLYEDAKKRRWIGDNKHERLLFVAAAERARSRGTTNPGGFFRRFVERNLWHFSK